MRELSLMDAAAMGLLSHDVVSVADADLGAPTPCDGWNVADLIDHMNQRHQAFLAAEFAPLDTERIDRRDAFAHIATRWGVVLERAADTVPHPRHGPVDTDWLLSVHVVDMITHRWDLSRALGLPCDVPERLLAVALPIARSITGPDSRLEYHASLPEDPAREPLDRIVALLGRDPDCQPVRS